MRLQCLIKSRYPGLYNRDMDFGSLGIVKVIEGVADVGPELANVMVGTGNFVRIDEFKDLVPEAAPEAPAKYKVAKAKVAKAVESY